MPASDITIEETTGADPLQITLRGRALPYQGLDFKGVQRTAVTWYPGNPKATQQVLGDTLDDTTAHGTWKAKFLREGTDYVIVGGGYFGQDLASENLVIAFELMRARGVQVKLTWGTIVRFGILSEFSAVWAREEDVEWTATFAWNGITDILFRAGDPTVSGQSVLEGTQAMDDVGSEIPDYMRGAYSSALQGSRRAIRGRAVQLLGTVRSIAQQVQTGATAAQAMVSRATYLAAEGIAFGRALRDENYVTGVLVDDVASVLGVEVWRMRMSGAVLVMTAAGSSEATATDLAYAPPAQEVVIVRQRTSLRQLALSAYGDADAWGQIAQANGLTSSVVEAGTQIVIPRVAQSPTLARGSF